MKTIKLMLAIVITLFIDNATFAQGIKVTYLDGSVKLEGYFVKAKTQQNKAPGIVIIHQWMGLSAHEKTSADKLGALGYHALAADIYGSGMMPKDQKEAAEKAGYFKGNYKIYQSRIRSAITELIKQGADPEKIVVMGYCFGGSGAVEAARGNLPVKGVISFHGGLGRDSSRAVVPIRPKVLILHGADDPFESEEEIKNFQKEMKNSKADWQMIYYANAVHAFTQVQAGNDNSKGAAYNELAEKRSWEHMKLFLKELFM